MVERNRERQRDLCIDLHNMFFQCHNQFSGQKDLQRIADTIRESKQGEAFSFLCLWETIHELLLHFFLQDEEKQKGVV